MTEALDETADGLDPDAVDRRARIGARRASRSGPGLGQAPGTRAFVHALVDRATMPLVIDADGLNAFAGEPDRLAGREGRDVIITPHPGRDGAAGRHVDRRGAGEPARDRAQLRRRRITCTSCSRGTAR